VLLLYYFNSCNFLMSSWLGSSASSLSALKEGVIDVVLDKGTRVKNMVAYLILPPFPILPYSSIPW